MKSGGGAGLTKTEVAACKAAGVSEAAYLGTKLRLLRVRRADGGLGAESRRESGLTKTEIAACRATGTSLAAYAVEKCRAAGYAGYGLIRAHEEIDRAHEAAHTEDPESRWQNAPIQEIIATAISELQAFDVDDDDTYEHLLMGVLHAARALDLVAPAFADQKPLPGEKLHYVAVGPGTRLVSR